MAGAGVTLQEVDLSTRVPGFPGVVGGIVIPAKRGPVNEPFQVTSDTQFLKKFTLNEKVEVGYSLGYFSALTYLEKSSALWVVRAANEALFGGLVARTSVSARAAFALSAGLDDPTAYAFDSTPDTTASAESSSFVCTADVARNKASKYFTFSTKVLPTNVDYYAWYAVSFAGLPEISTVTALGSAALAPAAPTDPAKYFTFFTATNNYYVYFIVDGDGVDPALGGGAIGIPVALGAADAATVVGGLTRTAISVSGIVVTGTGASITLTTSTNVNVSDTAAGTSGMTVSVSQQGEAAGTIGTDPALPSKTPIPVVIPENSSASSIATATKAAIDGVVGIAATTSLPVAGTLRILNSLGGQVSDATVGDSGFSVTIVQGIDEVNESDECLLITGCDPGVWNNSIGIKLYNYTTSPDKVKEPGAFLIEVYKSSNLSSPVESFVCSRTPGALDGYGRNIFVEDVFLASEFVRVISNPAVPTNVLPKEITSGLLMAAGDDGLACSDSQWIVALDVLRNKDSYPLTLIMDSGNATSAYQSAIISVCESRQDCIGILSTPYSAESSAAYMTDLVEYRKGTLNANSSYAALYTPHEKVYDKFNDRTLYIAPDGYAAAAISYSASNYELWYPPAGWKRGVVRVLDIRRRFDQSQIGTLYDAGINPFKYAPGKGIAIWGQKTLLGRPSSLDRLNVRLLLIYIEPAIVTALEDFTFDLNDESNRSLATTIVNGYMTNIQARKGVYEFQTICNDTNNTAVDIDNNRMNLDLYVKPTKSAEYIRFRTIITPTGVSFETAQGAV